MKLSGCKPKDKSILNKWKTRLTLYNTRVDLQIIPMVLCLSAVGCVHARLWEDTLWNSPLQIAPISATGGIFFCFLFTWAAILSLLFWETFYLDTILKWSPLGPFVFLPKSPFLFLLVDGVCVVDTVLSFSSGEWVVPADSFICVILATVQLRNYANQITVQTLPQNLWKAFEVQIHTHFPLFDHHLITASIFSIID